MKTGARDVGRGIATRVVAVVAIAIGMAGGAEAKGGARPHKGAEVEPIGTRLKDGETTLSVPISAEKSVVFSLPERFWLQVPRYGPNPQALAGEGLIAQYLNNRGGTVSMLYVGVVPFTSTDAPTVEKKIEGSAQDFVGSLKEKYASVGWNLHTGPGPVSPSSVTVGGKKVPAWRTGKYGSRPEDYAGPESTFVGECVLFQAEGLNALVYAALDAKGGGTTLDRAIERVSFKATKEVNTAGRRDQLIDIADSPNPDRYPVRQVAFDLPAGFVVTTKSLSLERDAGWAYAEQRLDAQGKVDALLLMRQRHDDTTLEPAKDHEAEKACFPTDPRDPTEEVPLAASGRVALVFTHASPENGETARGHTAVFRLDDQTMVLTWVSLGDAAQIAKDHAAFVALVRTIDLMTRW
jgi:hypothetical protein